MSTNTGGPAFPSNAPSSANIALNNQHAYGMTLRDYFAAKIIQGICSSGPGATWTHEDLAREAYEMADAMLRARETTT